MSARTEGPSLEGWIQIVRSEYEESPGLSLTREKATRLWNLDVDLGEAILHRLTTNGFLRQNAKQMFVRNDGDH